MKFLEAMKAVAEGKKVTNNSLLPGEYYMLKDGDCFYVRKNSTFLASLWRNEIAGEWELFEEKPKKKEPKHEKLAFKWVRHFGEYHIKEETEYSIHVSDHASDSVVHFVLHKLEKLCKAVDTLVENKDRD